MFFTPAPGLFYLRFKEKWVLFNYIRERGENIQTPNQYSETYIIKVWGKQKTAKLLVKNLLLDAKQKVIDRNRSYIAIIINSTLRYGQDIIKRKVRSLHSVILQDGLLDNICQDIDNYLQSKDWYLENGIPWKRGFLLQGKPGNGKSSLIFALAGHFKFNIFLFDLSDPDLTDTQLLQKITAIPENSIVAIEDIDTYFDGRKSLTKSKVTFSGFINALDGLASPEGHILFFTTNNRNKLDPALLRPGRVDREFFLQDPDFKQIEQLFLRFFPNKEIESKQFSNSVPRENVNMAMLQEHLLKHRDNIEAALQYEMKSIEVAKMEQQPLFTSEFNNTKSLTLN